MAILCSWPRDTGFLQTGRVSYKTLIIVTHQKIFQKRHHKKQSCTQGKICIFKSCRRGWYMLIMDLMKWNGESLVSAENCATSGSSSHCRQCTLVGFSSQRTRALKYMANLSIWRNILKLFELWKLDMWLSTLKNVLKCHLCLLYCNNVLITYFGGLMAIIRSGNYDDYLLNFQWSCKTSELIWNFFCLSSLL